MEWTEDSVKFYILGAISTMPSSVNMAMIFYSSEFEKMKEKFAYAMDTLKFLGIDEETINALENLKRLLSLPLTYTNEEKPFVEKLNAWVNALKKNSMVWLSLKDLPHEILRDVIDYEGIYQVSNYGRVKSFHRNRACIFKPISRNDYHRPLFFKNNHKKENLSVHKLIAQIFIPNPEGKPIINHKDGDKTNNCVWNLEWTTNSENQIHAHRMGLIKPKLGQDAPNAKLTAEQVHYIRELYKPYDKEFGANALAKHFGVTHSAILRIIHYKSYKNVT